jgi:hypothetical protein
MKLPTPVTIQPPTIHRPASGNEPAQERVQKPLVLSKLDVTTIDNSERRSCVARIAPCPLQLTLWEGEDYDKAGDYTQADVEARVLSLLGADIKAGLEALFVPPVRR